MRYIAKGIGPYEITKRPAPATSKTGRRAWSTLSKQSIYRMFFDEQCGLCGYSEISLEGKFKVSDRELDLGSHFEHIEPIRLAPNKTFVHSNIILNAIGHNKELQLRKEDVFGGKAKLDWYNHATFISPTQPDCERFFYYSTSGFIHPKHSLSNPDKLRAETTISKLNLNSPYLVRLRSEWLKQLEDVILTLQDKEGIRQLAEIELGLTNGQLRPFYSAQKQMLGV